MNKIVGVLAVATAVLVVIIMATLLPEVTVSVDEAEPFERQFGVQDERTTVPIPWFVVSVLAIGVGVWRAGWFIDWLERRSR